MKRLINQESKTENFPDSIGRTSILRGREFRTQKLTGSIGLTKYKSSFWSFIFKKLKKNINGRKQLVSFFLFFLDVSYLYLFYKFFLQIDLGISFNLLYDKFYKTINIYYLSKSYDSFSFFFLYKKTEILFRIRKRKYIIEHTCAQFGQDTTQAKH